MPFFDTDIPGLKLFDPAVFKDDRGYFFESYNAQTWAAQGVDTVFVQDNQSFSNYGVIRGLHYQQDPHAQTKLVRVLKGTILDVAVDIRKGSPHYGQVYCVELSAENKKQLLLPKGFAHGFSVLSETAEVLYKCDAFYSKATEAGIRFDDPQLNIDWKIPSGKQIVSEKDNALPFMKDAQNNFVY